jgi:alkylation response protein AidB-like acyl-CoA dehydrogenase
MAETGLFGMTSPEEYGAFGHPISEFEAVQLKLADMAASVQAARLMTWWAATKLDTNPRADVETPMAKVFASEAAITCALDSMRLHGAHGYSTEGDVERYYRDAPLTAIGEGTNDVLQTVIAGGLLRRLGTV